MRKYIFTLSCLLVFAFGNVLAQETETEVKKVDKPVRSPFESGYLIDNQTTVIQPVKTLEFAIQHKFGSVENGHSDLWGLYAPSANIRLGLNYVVAKNIQIGLGITKEGAAAENRLKMITDFNAKWTVLEQTRSDAIPIALAIYGNIAIDGRDKDNFAYDYGFSDRLSSFAQVIVGRKFNDGISLQTGISYSHFNLIDKGSYHDKVGVHLNGRFKVSPQGSIIFNVDVPLNLDYLDTAMDDNNPEPNLAFGYEISTSTHAFQIYMGNSKGLIQQDIMVNNTNKIELDNFMIGFTITRLWNF